MTLTFLKRSIADEEMEDELLDEILAVSDEEPTTPDPKAANNRLPKCATKSGFLEWLAGWARRIGTDTRPKRSLKRWRSVLTRCRQWVPAARRSSSLNLAGHRSTLRPFLRQWISGTGCCFQTAECRTRTNRDLREMGRTQPRNRARIGSRALDIRTALIEHFRDDASIMIATEAAAEGVNLQFCSLVVNYDLPWNSTKN